MKVGATTMKVGATTMKVGATTMKVGATTMRTISLFFVIIFFWTKYNGIHQVK
jgi:hypothetical protein